MNKRYSAILIMVLLLSACGISSEKYEAVKSEAAALQFKADSLQSLITELQKTPATLISEAQLQVKAGSYLQAKKTLHRITAYSITTQQKRDAFKLQNITNSKLEDIAFNELSGTGDVNTYKNFIKNYPGSKYSKRVKTQIKKLSTSQAVTVSSGTSNEISKELNYTSNASNNWSTSNSNEHAKSYKKATQYSTTRVGAICNDGSRSYATGRGACSHHGGVREWLYE